MSGCTSNDELNNDRELVERFLQEYYSQLTMTSTDWSRVEDTMNSDSDYNNWWFLDSFDSYMTELCLESYVSNRLLPNINMKDMDTDEVTIVGVELIKKDEGTYRDYYKNSDVDYRLYDISFTVKTETKGKTASFLNSIEIRIISENGHPIIDNVRGKMIWE
jgi:hypothetical protein